MWTLGGTVLSPAGDALAVEEAQVSHGDRHPISNSSWAESALHIATLASQETAAARFDSDGTVDDVEDVSTPAHFDALPTPSVDQGMQLLMPTIPGTASEHQHGLSPEMP